MRGRWYKVMLLGVMAVMLLGSALMQRQLNQQRQTITRVTPLENAPPLLAFTTVALGGFRGLIANSLWIRANQLQEQGKYFEMVQLADWITKLEPTFVQVWIVQAWNMAYNISVKFPDRADRWRWVQRGIELLRDDGLRYNPHEALLYRELAWFFQHKMGQNLDDAHLYYKREWAMLMTNAFGGPQPNFEELTNPSTPEARARAQTLREKYKMDPAVMREADRLYGPLEWRLPEAHAIYWAHVGLQRSKKSDLITLRRAIYQSLAMSVRRGRLVSIEPLRFGPDLSKAEAANAGYEKMIAEETEMKYAVQTAHKSFLGELVQHFYTHNRVAEANAWLNRLRQTYPDAVRPGITAEEYALERLSENLTQMGHDRTKALIEGLLTQYFIALAFDEDDRAQGLERYALSVWNFYMQRVYRPGDAVTLPPFEEIKRPVLEELLKPASPGSPSLLPPAQQEHLRQRTGYSAPPDKTGP
ncbi:MAG: hypothetical protein L0Y58_05540 [Verrucomicrobia subdivision 3 bacterium]|nr:hypothetical protein [Limisphaerales bacterium]